MKDEEITLRLDGLQKEIDGLKEAHTPKLPIHFLYCPICKKTTLQVRLMCLIRFWDDDIEYYSDDEEQTSGFLSLSYEKGHRCAVCGTLIKHTQTTRAKHTVVKEVK